MHVKVSRHQKFLLERVDCEPVGLQHPSDLIDQMWQAFPTFRQFQVGPIQVERLAITFIELPFVRNMERLGWSHPHGLGLNASAWKLEVVVCTTGPIPSTRTFDTRQVRKDMFPKYE